MCWKIAYYIQHQAPVLKVAGHIRNAGCIIHGIIRQGYFTISAKYPYAHKPAKLVINSSSEGACLIAHITFIHVDEICKMCVIKIRITVAKADIDTWLKGR